MQAVKSQRAQAETPVNKRTERRPKTADHLKEGNIMSLPQISRD